MKAIIDKIQKLLALSESSNQHEAEAAAQKAQEMLSKHNLTIDAVSLEQGNSTDAIDKTHFKFDGSMKKWRHELMWLVIQSVDCDGVFIFNKNVISSVTIYGLDQNVQCAVYIYKYLENTIDRLRKTYVKQYNKQFKEENGISLDLNQRYHIEKSYTLGIVKSVSYKLRQQQTDTPATPGALVPIIGALIEQKKQEDHGKLKMLHSRKGSIDGSAFNQGHKDGNNIHISKSITSEGNDTQLAIAH